MSFFIVHLPYFGTAEQPCTEQPCINTTCLHFLQDEDFCTMPTHTGTSINSSSEDSSEEVN